MLDDPNKLIRNYFEGPNHEKIDWKAEAEYFAQHIQRVAIDALPAEANPFDMQLFKQGMKGIHEGFIGVANVLDASSSQAGEAYMHIRNLMAAVFILGQSAVMSPKMKKILLSEFQSKKAKSSVRKNQQKASEWQEPVIELAKDLRCKNPLLKQDDLATKILEKWNTIDSRAKSERQSHIHI